jgi:hypothetical protein
MVSCAEVLSDELRGYSTDTLAILSDESLPYDECEQLLARAEVDYG